MLTIKEYTSADQSNVVALTERYFAECLGGRSLADPDLNPDATWSEEQSKLLLAFERQGAKKLVGMLGILRKDDQTAFLKRMYVEPSFRPGAAIILLKRAVEFARSAQYSILQFNADPITGKTFEAYQKFGAKRGWKSEPINGASGRLLYTVDLPKKISQA